MEPRYRALIADDEPSVCHGLIGMVAWEELGFAPPDCCHDGKSAFETVLSKHYDMLILDIRMPGLTGLELVSKLRRYAVGCQYIIISAHEDFEYAREALRHGAGDYLLKPVNRDRLLGAIRAAAAKLMEESRQRAAPWGQEALIQIGELRSLMKTNHLEKTMLWFREVLPHIIARKDGEDPDLEYLSFVGERIRDLVDPEVEGGPLVWTDPPAVGLRLMEECRQTILLRTASPAPPEENTLEAILHYVHENFHKSLSLSQIAGRFFLNPAYLGRLFSSGVGESFNSYLGRVRVEKAKLLLRDNRSMVYEICEAVGYRDLNYFYKVFKAQTGMTPSQYREKHRPARAGS